MSLIPPEVRPLLHQPALPILTPEKIVLLDLLVSCKIIHLIGKGKTSILHKMLGAVAEWTQNTSQRQYFSMCLPKDMLSSMETVVGLSCPPHWFCALLMIFIWM